MKLSNKNIISFFTRLDVLQKAGLTLSQSLELIQGTDQVGIVSVYIGKEINKGKTFSETIEHIQGIPYQIIEPIRVGESHGVLNYVCGRIAESLKRQSAYKKQIVGSLLYPVIILCMCVVLVIGMFFLVVPRMLGVFSSMNIVLPLPTRILIFFNHTVTTWWWLILMATPLLLFVTYIFLKRVSLKLPFIGNILKRALSADMFSLLALLLGTGVPLDQALLSIVSVSRDPSIQKILESIAEEVGKGKKLSEQFRAYPHLFSTSSADMIAAGEASGSVGTMCDHLARIHEDSLTQTLHTLSTLIEPALLIGVGVLTAFVALALMMPLYQITSSLNAH